MKTNWVGASVGASVGGSVAVASVSSSASSASSNFKPRGRLRPCDAEAEQALRQDWGGRAARTPDTRRHAVNRGYHDTTGHVLAMMNLHPLE